MASGNYSGFTKEFATITVPDSGAMDFHTEFDLSKVTAIIFSVEGNAIRFRTDGGDPTTSIGHRLEIGSVFEILGEHDVQDFKIISVSGDATIQASTMVGGR
jgi:hypothetical protein